MRTKPAYLVIDTYGRTPTISHVRASWPRLDPGQMVVRIAVEIPDESLPKVQTVHIEASEAVMVEPMLPEPPEEDE